MLAAKTFAGSIYRNKKPLSIYFYQGSQLNSIITILFSFIILVSFVTLFVKISMRIRRSGGSIPYFISSGAMDATLNKEKKAATEVIVERNAHKKMEEQSSFDPL